MPFLSELPLLGVRAKLEYLARCVTFIRRAPTDTVSKVVGKAVLVPQGALPKRVNSALASSIHGATIGPWRVHPLRADCFN